MPQLDRLLDTVDPSPAEADAGRALAREWLTQGYLPGTCPDLLAVPDGVIAAFYAEVAAVRGTRGPAHGRADSGWMADTDFCFVNVRATGTGERRGTFLSALKLLPGIRAGAIHLGPFTRYDFGVIYAVQSAEEISPDVVDAGLEARGLSAEEQLGAFVAGAHALGMAVGYDLEPHTAQFSLDALEQPELFRWVRVDAADPQQLSGGVSSESMLAEDAQGQLVAEVRTLVGERLAAEGLDRLSAVPGEPRAARERRFGLFGRLVGELIQAGYWTVPSHSWCGAGLPAFGGFNTDGNYATFRYLDAAGQDAARGAMHIMAPYKFHLGLPVNRVPEHAAPVPHEAAIARFAALPVRFLRDFGFDFVRYDSVDHVFDSVDARGWALSDRPTPAVLARAVAAAKAVGPWVGHLAERMGNEIEDYAGLGFDLVLGDDMLQRVDRALVEKGFALHDRLLVFNAGRAARASIPCCVDTHDTGNPHLCGAPLVAKCSPEALALRLFYSRFASCGAARRPKYEVMGLGDRSHGLYNSNINIVNLEWVGDAAFNERYHWLEDLHRTMRGRLARGRLAARQAADELAWWVIEAGDALLVAVLAPERDHPGPRGPLSIDLAPWLPAGASAVLSYDFPACQSAPAALDGTWLRLDGLPDLACRLYLVTLPEAA